MRIMDKGRICIVKKGRDFGKAVMISSVDEKSNDVEIEGPRMNKRKVNIFHLWPTDKVVKSLDDMKNIIL